MENRYDLVIRTYTDEQDEHFWDTWRLSEKTHGNEYGSSYDVEEPKPGEYHLTLKSDAPKKSYGEPLVYWDLAELLDFDDPSIPEPTIKEQAATFGVYEDEHGRQWIDESERKSYGHFKAWESEKRVKAAKLVFPKANLHACPHRFKLVGS
jgi:hypothetical protein